MTPILSLPLVTRSYFKHILDCLQVDEGYFVHFFAPEFLPKLRKHVVFVLDYSGSMEGRKLDQLKEAMTKILSDISDDDYFSVVIFQSYVEVRDVATNITKEVLFPALSPV